MARFYIPAFAWNPDRLALSADEAHHAADVLRLKAGDRATVFNGEGTEAEVEILKIHKHGADLRRIGIIKTPRFRCRITLGQAIPKGKNMELIVEKASELGVDTIVPLMSDRTIVRGDEADAVRKQQKWQRVAIEACKQCGQNWLPRVERPMAPKAFFERNEKFDLMLVASLQSDSRPLKEYLAETAPKHPRSVLVIIGPEGDLTPAEVALAKTSGCRALTLGPIILRTETAALYSLSVLGHELF